LQLTVKAKVYNSYGTMKLFNAAAVLSFFPMGANAAAVATCALQQQCIGMTVDRSLTSYKDS
jgi:hypothetical protein